MDDLGKEQPVSAEPDKTTEIRNFIETNSNPLKSGLVDILQSSQIVLLGDSHTQAAEKLRESLTTVLPVLKTQGGITAIAVELDSSHQQQIDALSPDDPNLEAEIAQIAPVGWYQGNKDFLVAAKRLGLKVNCIDLIDKQRADSQRDNAVWQNQRDSHMFETLERMTDTSDRILVLVGNDHVQKRVVKKYDDGEIKPLGMQLAEKFGLASVTSIRPVYREGSSHFDNLLPFMSKTPMVSEVVAKDDPIVLVPDKGPIKGDPRVTATDYVVIA